MLKKFFYLLVMFFCCLFSQAQSTLEFHSSYEQTVIDGYLKGEFASLELQLVADPNVSESKGRSYSGHFNKMLSEFISKQSSMKSDERFLSWMFYKVHRKVLKNYTPYSTVAETLSLGSYDCLSATTLYALLLDELGYNVDVVETTYHIYLLIHLESNTVMFESTDPIYGFIDNPLEIEKRLTDINGQKFLDNNIYKFKKEQNRTLSLHKLTGLQYFNIAVETYNNKELLTTLDLLEKASLFYHSERITEFGVVLASAINNAEEIDFETKRHSMNRISKFLKVTESVVSR